MQGSGWYMGWQYVASRRRYCTSMLPTQPSIILAYIHDFLFKTRTRLTPRSQHSNRHTEEFSEEHMAVY